MPSVWKLVQHFTWSRRFANAKLIHRAIMEASGNSVLLRLWQSLAFETIVRARLAREPIDLDHVSRSYRAIFAAMEAGDGKLAGRLLREHAEAFAPAEQPPSCVSGNPAEMVAK